MNEIQLFLNDNPLWTNRHIDNYLIHIDAFGELFNKKQIIEERQKIANSCSNKRVDYPNKCFEIYIDDKHIGDINLHYVKEQPEMTFLIFDEFSNNGYAKRAIKKYLENGNNTDNCIECLVRHENKDYAKVVHILTSLNFHLVGKFEDSDLFSFTKADDL